MRSDRRGSFQDHRRSRTPKLKAGEEQNRAQPRQPPQQPAHSGKVRQYGASTPHDGYRGPRFATVDLIGLGDGKDPMPATPNPAGPCPHGHLEQAVSLIIHRRNPVRCPFCGGIPVFITQTEEHPLSVLELRKSPTNTVHIHQPVALNGREGGRGWNEPPEENG